MTDDDTPDRRLVNDGPQFERFVPGQQGLPPFFARNCQSFSDLLVTAAIAKTLYLTSAELADIYDRPTLPNERATPNLLKAISWL